MSSIGIDFLARLESFRLRDEPDAAFSRRIGVSLTTLRDWKLLRDAARDFEPKMRTVRTIVDRLNANFLWLYLGEGEHHVASQVEGVTMNG